MNQRHLWILALSLMMLSCSIKNNTDALEPHHIQTAPPNKWVSFQEETPIDVTEPEIKTNHFCTRHSRD